MKKNLPDIIKRTAITVIGAAFLAYIVYLFTNGQVIVQGEYENLNELLYVLLTAFILYKIVFFGIFPKALFGMKMTKATMLVSGIILILIGHYVLLNDASNHIFLWDIVKIIWVIITILGPTNMLISKKVKKKADESKMEIIEA